MLWLRPRASALSRDCLDRHHRIHHNHADALVLRPWLGAHEHVIAMGDLPAHSAVSLDLQSDVLLYGPSRDAQMARDLRVDRPPGRDLRGWMNASTCGGF